MAEMEEDSSLPGKVSFVEDNPEIEPPSEAQALGGNGNGNNVSPDVGFDKHTAPTLPKYPTHGVIGDSDPEWLDIFHSTKNLKPQPKEHFHRQKFDFHETYEKQFDREEKVLCNPTPIPGLYNLWHQYKGLKTSDLYEIDPNLPIRFKNPSLLQGYGWEKDEHPFFQTTSSAYGKLPPTVHDVPIVYHGLKSTFTTHLASTGMPKNRSLNIK